GLKEGVLDIIANVDEVQMIRQLPEGVHWDAVLFSAKESIYKAWFPSGGPLGWEDVSIVFHPESGTFNAANPAQLEGRFLITKDFVLTAVVDPIPIPDGDQGAQSRPPVTAIVWPLINEAPFDARNMTTWATSWSSPMRPAGQNWTQNSR